MVLADLRGADAEVAALSLSGSLGRDGLSSTAVDVSSPESLAALLRADDVVVNCTGPFYRFGPPVLRAAIEAGVTYVDVCDDLDPTLEMLELDGLARERGVRALIGMGSSPGLANVFVRLCDELLLDRTEAVDIMHVHGGEPSEGAAVVKHRIAAMLRDVPVFVDGEVQMVRMLDDSGRAFVRETDFRDVGRLPAYPYPHPETATLPRHLPDLQRVTNRGVVVPLAYFELTMAVVRAGLCTAEPLTVGGVTVPSIEVAVAHILAQRPRLLADAGVTGPKGCLKVVVSGTKNGEPHTYALSLSSGERGAGEGTGIPAALAAIMMARGRIDRTGVFPPEAAVAPLEMLSLVSEVSPAFGMGGPLPLIVQHTRPDGTVEEVALPL